MTTQHWFIARHGAAVAHHPALRDRDRALTPEGRAHVTAVGQLLGNRPEAIDVVLTSPRVRAVQTAERIIAGSGLDPEVHVASELGQDPAPTDIEAILKAAPRYARGILLVGHQPGLGAFAHHLEGTPESLHFSTGEVRCYALGPRPEFRFRISGHPPRVCPRGTDGAPEPVA